MFPICHVLNVAMLHVAMLHFAQAKDILLTIYPLLKIAPIRAEFGPKSIPEICADELFFVPCTFTL